jgi:hypothetical protein
MQGTDQEDFEAYGQAGAREEGPRVLPLPRSLARYVSNDDDYVVLTDLP